MTHPFHYCFPEEGIAQEDSSRPTPAFSPLASFESASAAWTASTSDPSTRRLVVLPPVIASPSGGAVESETAKKVSCSSSSSKRVAGSSSSPDAMMKRPKRAFTPYNLFFRYHRVRMLMAVVESSHDDCSSSSSSFSSYRVAPESVTARDKDNVRRLLETSPYLIDNRTRSHRKTPYGIGFREMVSRISALWKKSDDETRAVFRDLADEDKLRHAREMEAYNNKRRLRDEKEHDEAKKLPSESPKLPSSSSPPLFARDVPRGSPSRPGLMTASSSSRLLLFGSDEAMMEDAATSCCSTSSILQDALSLADAPLPPLLASTEEEEGWEGFSDDDDDLPVAADLASLLQ